MKIRARFPQLLLLVVDSALLLLLPVLARAQTTPAKADALKKANIAFSGTVSQVGAVSLRNVPVSPKMIVVKVERVLEKPSAVALKPGDEVTVETIDPAGLRPGDRQTFYATGWIYGKNLAVREIAHEPLPPPGPLTDGRRAEPPTQIQQLRQQALDRELTERIKAADVVVTGQVTQVRAWTGPANQTPRRVSEHNPNWQEAIVEVVTGIKNAPSQKVVVRFPSSMDVSWRTAPRFKPGQSLTLLLKKDRVSGVPRAMLSGAQVQTYTALNPRDVMSISESSRIQALARGAKP
jgi:hypothetical protein